MVKAATMAQTLYHQSPCLLKNGGQFIYISLNVMFDDQDIWCDAAKVLICRIAITSYFPHKAVKYFSWWICEMWTGKIGMYASQKETAIHSTRSTKVIFWPVSMLSADGILVYNKAAERKML